MGDLRSSSLSGSNNESLKLPVLPYVLILLHMYMYVVVGVSITTGDGLNLTSVEKVYLVNTTILINCSLNDSSQRTNASDVMWTFDGEELLNATTPQLVIEKAHFEDSGVYECKVYGPTQEKDIRWDVKVGSPPAKATIIGCVSYDFRSLNCSWENGEFTNIATTHVLQYRTYGGAFKDCQDGICELEDANFEVRVNSSNALGVDIYSEVEHFKRRKIMVLTPVRSPIVTNATSTSLRVAWLPSKEYCLYPDDSFRADTKYEVRYELGNTLKKSTSEFQKQDSCQDSCQDSSTISGLHSCQDSLTISGLQANSVYTIGITVTHEPMMQSKEITLEGKTKEIAPEAGVNLKLLCPRINGTNESLLSWTPFPEDKSNGKILGYDITINNNSSVITKDPNVTEHRLRDVDLYSDYNITIVARNSVGTSDIDKCYISALTHADPSAVVSIVLIIVGAVLFVVIFILAFKFYICFKKSKITKIKLPHHIQHDNFYLYGGPQRRAPCEQERYDELITKTLVDEGPTLCNSTIPNGTHDPSREPIMPESKTTEVSTT